jgi:uncharacterized protein
MQGRRLQRRGEPAVGRRIAESKRSRGLFQAALAAAASIDRTALSKIETGRRGVGSTELVRIAEALEHFFAENGASADLLRTIRSKRRAILRICRKHGAHSPRLFGSVARGQATPASDIDIVVDMEQGRSLLDQAALLVELRELLGRDVDVVTAQGLRDRIRERVLVEAVPL